MGTPLPPNDCRAIARGDFRRSKSRHPGVQGRGGVVCGCRLQARPKLPGCPPFDDRSFPSAQLLSASADWELLQRGWKGGRAQARHFQEHALQPDGRIRYLNTAGFAMRRKRIGREAGVFDEAALRGEDTLLLANLIEGDTLPLFVPEAIVEHAIPLSLMECLRKDIRTAYLEGRTYERIASTGVRIRVTQRERLRLLLSMWRTANRPSIGRTAWFVLVGRQALQRMISFGYNFLRVGSERGL